ncbi:MAG: GNAT family N-acetyltransferase [Candidatus Izemoplasmatales bacterium]
MKNIKFIKDNNFIYNDKIISELKNYNQSQTGYREKDKQNFYIFEDQDLVAIAHTKMASDWCHIMQIYYKNFDSLKALINNIKEFYKDKVEGIQYQSILANRISDLKKLKFIQKGQLKDMVDGKDYVFLLTTDFTIDHEMDNYQKHTSDKQLSKYDRIMKKANQKIKKSLHYSSEDIDVQFVALDGDQFVGGIYGNYQYQYLFINILFVDKDYRGNNIASKLMDLIEEDAYNRGVYNLYLTTFEFQALGFYQKRNYKKIMEIYDYPIGFKEYTVYKKLKE